MTPPVPWVELREAVERKGYRWFDGGGDYNLNIVGIRSASRRAGAFDDLLCLAFRQAGQELVLTFRCTTDPGRRYLRDPINDKGAAILKPGQYRGMWEIGMHRSRYSALVQRGPCTVWRDANRDDFLDDGPAEETGYFGINLHHAVDVDHGSAGCQVVSSEQEHHLIMALAELAEGRYGRSFTYTLLTEADI